MKEIYRTSDIVLAATLKFLRYELAGIEIIPGKRNGIFSFKNVSDEDITDYHLDKIIVEPKEFNGAVRTLTTAVRQLLVI